jgi:prevent-host-death family protein
MRTMKAGEFKAKCLGVLDEVHQTGEPVLITKRGKPVAKVTALAATAEKRTDVASIFESLRGLATIVGNPEDLIEPLVPTEEWDHLKSDWNPLPEK